MDWPATCSSTARSARAPPGCTSPTTTRRSAAGNSYLDVDAIAAHLRACTEAGITAGFHVIGDAAVTAVVTALERVVDHFGAPAVARCGHRLEHLEMVTEDQAARLGSWGVFASMQPNFDALWGGEEGMYVQRLGLDRGTKLNPFALLASQGVPIAFGSDSPVTGLNPWATVRAATRHRTPGSAVSARAAFAAATRGAWRAGGDRDGVTGTLVPGAPASYAIWEADDFEVSAAARRGAALVDRPALPGARPAATRRPVAALPTDGSSGCRHPWLRSGRRREWARATDDTDVVDDDAESGDERRRRRP